MRQYLHLLTLAFLVQLLVFDLRGQEIKLVSVIEGLNQPVDIAHAGDERLFIVERMGIIRVYEAGQLSTFMNISSRLTSLQDEQGLLGLAFHPNYAANGIFYVNYTDTNGHTVISRFFTNFSNVGDPSSEEIILTADQPFANHNGGALKFGPDGYLYIGLGDGGSGNDPMNNGQNRLSLLGKILRIDIDEGDPYSIPSSNPFAYDDFTLDEIWSLGLRNPWRFSFDRLNGDLYIGEVGQNLFEEINREDMASAGGLNYGWRCFEGFESFNPSYCDDTYESPIYVYNHTEGCSVTGGFVYRGSDISSLIGKYVYGDYCTGTIWTLEQIGGTWINNELAQGMNISTFGEDVNGELYYADLFNGVIYKFESTVTSTHEESNSFLDFDVIPNPVKESFNLNIQDNFSGLFEIYDVLGRKQMSGNFTSSSNKKIDLQAIGTGEHYIIVTDGLRKATKKFIIID